MAGDSLSEFLAHWRERNPTDDLYRVSIRPTEIATKGGKGSGLAKRQAREQRQRIVARMLEHISPKVGAARAAEEIVAAWPANLDLLRPAVSTVKKDIMQIRRGDIFWSA